MRLLLVFALSCSASQARTVQHVTQWTLAGSLGGMMATLGAAYIAPGDNPVLIGVGLALVPVAVASAFTFAAVDSMAQAPEQPTSEHNRSWQAAMELARQAKHAARAGDCAQVQATAPRVRELDMDVYARFMRDPVIRTCLGPAE